jgi:G3E family GTPase
VAIADHLIVTKGDLVDALSDPVDNSELRARLRQINPRGGIHEGNRGEIDIELFTGRADEDADAAFRDFSTWLRAAEESTGEKECHDHDHSHEFRHDHGNSKITSFTIEMDRPVDCGAFNLFLQELAIEYGENLLRMKGILHVEGETERPAVIHGVQHVFFPVSWLEKWPDDERTSKLVFITQDLDPQLIKSRFGEYCA